MGIPKYQQKWKTIKTIVNCKKIKSEKYQKKISYFIKMQRHKNEQEKIVNRSLFWAGRYFERCNIIKVLRLKAMIIRNLRK